MNMLGGLFPTLLFINNKYIYIVKRQFLISHRQKITENSRDIIQGFSKKILKKVCYKSKAGGSNPNRDTYNKSSNFISKCT